MSRRITPALQNRVRGFEVCRSMKLFVSWRITRPLTAGHRPCSRSPRSASHPRSAAGAGPAPWRAPSALRAVARGGCPGRLRQTRPPDRGHVKHVAVTVPAERAPRLVQHNQPRLTGRRHAPLPKWQLPPAELRSNAFVISTKTSSWWKQKRRNMEVEVLEQLCHGSHALRSRNSVHCFASRGKTVTKLVVSRPRCRIQHTAITTQMEAPSRSTTDH